MSRCKSCGAEIVWVKLRSGKSHPCNLGYYHYEEGGTDRLVTEDGDVVSCTIVQLPGMEGIGQPKGRRSHFATCPNASKHRRRP